MSDKAETPKKIWLEYSPDEQHLHLTDELVWTGCLTEYVRGDYHHRLREALDKAHHQMLYLNQRHEKQMCDPRVQENIRALLAELNNLENGS